MSKAINGSRITLWICLVAGTVLVAGLVFLASKDDAPAVTDRNSTAPEAGPDPTGGGAGNNSGLPPLEDPVILAAAEKMVLKKQRKKQVEKITKLLWTSRSHDKMLAEIRRLGEVGELEPIRDMLLSEEWYENAVKRAGTNTGGISLAEAHYMYLAIELVKTGDPRAEQILMEEFTEKAQLNDPAWNERTASLLQAAAYLQKPAEKTYRILKEAAGGWDEHEKALGATKAFRAYRQDYTEASFATNALANIGSPQSLQILSDRIFDTTLQRLGREHTIEALRLSKTLEAVELLGQVLERSKEPTLRQSAFHALKAIVSLKPFRGTHGDRYAPYAEIDVMRRATEIAVAGVEVETDPKVRRWAQREVKSLPLQLKRMEEMDRRRKEDNPDSNESN